MKIAYCIHSFHRIGGKERILCYKANWLADKMGYEVYIITSNQKGRKPFFELSPNVRCMDIGVNDIFFKRRYLKALNSLLNGIRPDISISLCGPEIFVLDRCDDGSRKFAEFHFMHDKFHMEYGSRLYARFRTKRLFSKMLEYERVVVLSKYDLDWFRKLAESRGMNPEKIQQIYNPTTISSGQVSPLDAKRFLCVGSLRPEKDFSNAVRIWKKVILKHPDWILDIYGDGPELSRLSALIIAEHLEESVFLRGKSQNPSKEYPKASGLLMTSRYEGLPLVAIEAMCFGLPIVAFNCPGGLPELVDSGSNGFLTAPGDIDNAAAKVCALIEDASLRHEFARYSLKRIGELNPESIMRQWDGLLHSPVISRNGISG